jgi:hypothetical protein
MLRLCRQGSGCARGSGSRARHAVLAVVILALSLAGVSANWPGEVRAQGPARPPAAESALPAVGTPESPSDAGSGSPFELVSMPPESLAWLNNPYRVGQVLSGEKVQIKVADRFVVIRLLGVSTARREARDLLKGLTFGGSVCLEYDPDRTYDRDGHPAAYLFRAADGLFLNHALIAQGYSGLDDELGPRAETLKRAYQAAKAGNFGLWFEGSLVLTSPPSLEYLESLKGTVAYRARVHSALRDYNSGVVDAYYAGRQEAAYAAGQASVIKGGEGTSRWGNYGKVKITNNLDAEVKVNVLAELYSNNLVVAARQTRSFAIPFGHYQVSFQVEGETGKPHTGEPFDLAWDPVEMTIGTRTEQGAQKPDGKPGETGETAARKGAPSAAMGQPRLAEGAKP